MGPQRAFHKIWSEPCEAALRIREEYWLSQALDHLILSPCRPGGQ